jgi:hypothetical protein
MTNAPHPFLGYKAEFLACNAISQLGLNLTKTPVIGVPGLWLRHTGEQGRELALGYDKKI